MEDDDFFEHFRNGDLSGIKKFNFKKFKTAKSSEKTISSLKSNVSKSTFGSTKTLDFEDPLEVPFHFSQVNLNKTEATTNIHDSLRKPKLSPEILILNNSSVNISKGPNFIKPPNSPAKNFTFKRKESSDKGIISSGKTNILSKQGRSDSILDTLYKNTLSIKKDLSETEKQSSLKFTLTKKDDFDAVALKTTKITELALNTKKNDSKTKSLEGSPSFLSGFPELASKGNFSISKYFNDEYKANSLKSNGLIPFKKLLETKKAVTGRDEQQKISYDEKLDNCVCREVKTSPKKKFVFKKRPLNLTSSCFDDVFNRNEKESKETISFSNNFVVKPDETHTKYLDLALNASTSKRIDNIVEYNNTLDNKDSDLQESGEEAKTRNSINAEDSEEEFSQLVSTSQSLGITNDDYMDDEEFERRFGNLAEQFDKSAFNSKEKDVADNMISTKSANNTSEKLDHHNTEELLNDISNINWDDNCFEDESIQEGFKDRDDDSKEFKGNYEHTEVMLEMLHQKFGLKSFRPHQREVINASLMQHDCFVLMPTGGGKSLCYQLPAVLMPGVTMVISPLRALISDQVDKLNALDITAAHLCSDVSKAECEQIYMKLSMREPAIKLLYLTPEKISASRVIIDILNSLYQRGKLARFVIDEVHCLSQWGHDFRPDYKELSLLRKNYKDVPIICLTATATKQVEHDVINILGLKNVKRFIRSFNRPNIKYQVLPKNGKKTTEEIANLIKSKFQKQSGIVYCLGRKDCDNLAERFNDLGIKSKPYHAGMNDKVRDVIQREWMQDRFHVIVATIAFGMGIDKPDVRFVIHNSIPKSVEAFYQESGRAGRDGEVSYSYLFYSYGDVDRLQKLMQLDRNMTKKTLDAHKENLKHMVSFAENLVDCRRYLLLIHLGEHFDRRICIRNKTTICDNCENIHKYETIDVTQEAKQLCTIVKDLTNSENVTMLYVADIYRGAKIKKILDRGHNKHIKYGAGAHLDRTDVQRILKELILKQILNDFCAYTGDFPVIYIQTGPKFYQFFNSDCKLHISVCTNKERRREVVKVNTIQIGNKSNANDTVDSPKPSTSGVVRHTIQKQATAKLQAARKLQLTQLKVQCHEALLEECRRLAMERNLTLSSVMNLSAIKTMSEVLPESKEEMLKIQHVTNANYNKYGELFLKITEKFRKNHDALLPLTVASKSDSFNEKTENVSGDEYQSDFYPTNSQNSEGSSSGIKRKNSWRSKKGAYKRKSGSKRKRSYVSPKTKTAAKSGWKGKGKGSQTKTATSSGWKGKGSRGGGGLDLMPLHFK